MKITVEDSLLVSMVCMPPQEHVECRVLAPVDFDGERLTEVAVERYFERLYGAGWTFGNVDGSLYVPLTLMLEHQDGEHEGVVVALDVATSRWDRVGS